MYRRSLIPSKGDNLGITVIVLDAVFLTFAAVAICIRLWSRRIQGLRWAINDYAIVLAWPLTAGLVTTAILAVATNGGGQHIQNVEADKIPGLMKGFVAADITWGAAKTAVEISFLHLYLTIIGMGRTSQRGVPAVMAFVTSVGLGIILSSFLICRPFAKSWNPLLQGTCGFVTSPVLSTSIINIVVDLIIFTLPAVMIWPLQMAEKRKVALTITFVCIITILRIVLSAQLVLNDGKYVARLTIVTDLEPLLGNIVAGLSLYPPALTAIMVKLRSGSRKNQDFRKSDDSFPFTELEANGTQNELEANGTQNDITRSEIQTEYSVGESALDTSNIQNQPNQTKVKQSWDVQTQGMIPQ